MKIELLLQMDDKKHLIFMHNTVGKKQENIGSMEKSIIIFKN